MRMNQPRGALTAQIPRKRKEREDLFLASLKSNNKGKQVQQTYGPPPSHPNTTSSKPKPSEPVLSNRLLAGYMAHEFLTQGTLLGQKFDPARAQAEPKKKPSPDQQPPPRKSYAEVATLLKTDGAHITGIVNPTQLAHWIQM